MPPNGVYDPPGPFAPVPRGPQVGFAATNAAAAGPSPVSHLPPCPAAPQNYTGAQEWIEKHKLLQHDLDAATAELNQIKEKNRLVWRGGVGHFGHFFFLGQNQPKNTSKTSFSIS